MKKKISIIIPYFNNLKYLPNAIRSVIYQNLKNYEIILIYDDTNKQDLKEIKKI